MTTTYPFRYGESYKEIDELLDLLSGDGEMHPEFRRRLRAWFIYKEGEIGGGGGWRATGEQPDKPGFAEEGRSFHQDQPFPSGIFFTAVDLVAPDGTDSDNWHDGVRWADVPVQGTAEAKKWGLHCNVGAPPTGEPWHIQPIEIDGWQSWVNAGRPDLQSNYPIPGGEVLPELGPEPPVEEDEEMPRYFTIGKDAVTPVFELHGRMAVWVDGERWATLSKDGVKLERFPNPAPAVERMVLLGAIDNNNPRWHKFRDMFGQVVNV